MIAQPQYLALELIQQPTKFILPKFAEMSSTNSRKHSLLIYFLLSPTLILLQKYYI